MKQLLIWGTGKAALVFNKHYKKKYEKYIDIVGYVDKNMSKQNGLFFDKKVYSPMEITKLKWDVILICTMDQTYQEEMMQYLLDLGISKRKIATFINYEGFGVLREVLIEKYNDSKDIEIKQMINYLENKEPGVFNIEMDRKNEKYPIYLDESDADPYILLNDKRLYYPKEVINIKQRKFITDLYYEQSKNSPHLYLPSNKQIKKESVIVDAGTREGNFGIKYVDDCKKLYLIECDKIWCRVLEKTFKPYRNKVQIINVFLGERDSLEKKKIDTLIKESVDFIKMDIEGAELKTLKGAERVLRESNAFCSICAYHKKNDEKKIKNIMNQFGYKTYTSNGYMLFLWDEEFYEELDLRRGIVYAEK